MYVAHVVQALYGCQCAEPNSLHSGQLHAATSLLAQVKQRVTQQLQHRQTDRQTGPQNTHTFSLKTIQGQLEHAQHAGAIMLCMCCPELKDAVV